jgi:hypothetical protein
MATTRRNEYDQRFAALDKDYSEWETHYKELSKFILPRTGRFSEFEVNEGKRFDQFIIDSTATRANRTLAAGMMAGMTSPARPWFRLATADSELMERQEVKEWTHSVLQMMRRIFAASNTYRSLHTMYTNLGVYGTAASIMQPDFEDVIRHYNQPTGRYRLAQGKRGNVDTIYRELPMTISQLVQEFGKDNVSASARSLYNSGNLDAVVFVRHVIEPRHDRDRTKRDKMNMPWTSVYYEKGADDGRFLREGGYTSFPGLTPRWSLEEGDTYGASPGMESLGDVQQLQFSHETKDTAFDYQARPPVQIPSSLKGQGHDLLPGGESYYDDIGGPSGGIRTAFEVNLNAQGMLSNIEDIRARINSTFYADLFTMMATSDRRQMTATEVAERHEEKLLVLGPVLERLHNEMLDPLIDRTFDMMVAARILPPPPDELQGQDIKVEYVSMLAQAQRAVGVTSVDRLLGTVGSISQFKADALDKLNTDQIVDDYADMLGVSPEFIVGNEDVAIIRQQRAEQAAQQQQMEAIPQAAQAAKTLSETDTEGDNALTRVFSGL